MNDEISFGQIVKEHRRALDLTQAELARRVACATITVRKIEADALRPSQQIAERLAMALNIPLDERSRFVRLARMVMHDTPEPPPLPTPPPTPEEIGEEDLSGRAIRGYELGERIGAGGFGAVYRAIQPLIEREVAIKIILPQYANHPDFIRRFEAEAQLVARLEHPYIVPLYDYWREPGGAYLVMRLLRGGSLRQALQSGPLPLETVAVMLEQVGAALHAAHRVGVVHRDLKPANVLMDEDGNGYLADFGIAKNLSDPDMENLTQTGAIIGSPAYTSPEQIRSEPVKPQADIYCLGVLLYELLSGHKPFLGPTPVEYIMQHLSEPLPPLDEYSALDPIVQRATAKDPLERYPNVQSLLADFRQAVTQDGSVAVAVDAIPYRVAVTVKELENPYKGLRPFGEADADDFFGRETLVQEMLACLADADNPTAGSRQDLARFMAVVGPSGSGKSSAVKAGLIPALRQGGLPGSENWFIIDLMPGAHPLEELEAALLRVAVNPPESLLAQLREDERGLLRAVHRVLPADPNIELVLVIDQFEEVFTQVADESVRAHLLDSLVAAVLDERSRVRVVVTMRADFTGRALEYIDFGELVRQRTAFVLPLTPDELEQAIVGPAARAGLVVEPGLVATTVQDVGDRPGMLPLLQYALTELFEQREGRTMTLAAYQESGGVTGALGRRAEELYTGLEEPAREAARQLFLRLVTLGEGVEDTRRRVLRTELSALQISEVWETSKVLDTVIDLYGRYRLLTFDHDPVTRGPTVEVAHEALLREWPRLRGWLESSRTDVHMQRLLAAAAAEWEGAGREPSYLLVGTRLAQFEGWAEGSAIALTQDERTYLEASVTEWEVREAEEAERQQRELKTAQRLAETERARAEAETRRAEEQVQATQRLRWLAVGLTIFLVAAIAATFLAVRQTRRAEQQTRLTTSRELAMAATNNLDADPERSILLALEAVSVTYAEDKTVTLEAENALHRAVQASRVLLTLSGHADRVTGVAWSSDGSRLATGSYDGTAKVWDATSGQELLTLSGHSDTVLEVEFSPDGSRLATAGYDLTAKVWDLEASAAGATGQELLTLSGHAAPVNGVAFSPDGARLATASLDTTAKVWDIGSGQELFTLAGHSDQVWDVTFSPDGTRLATASVDGTAKVWDAISGEELLTLSVHDDIVSRVAFSPDGTRLATTGNNGMAKVWDAASGEELLTLTGHTTMVLWGRFSPDGMRIATTSTDGTVKVWDAASGEELLTLSGHTSLVLGLAFSPDGTRLVTGSFDGTAKVWDLSPDRELLTLAGHTEGVFSLAFSPDGTRLATASEDGTAKVWDLEASAAATSGRELLTLLRADRTTEVRAVAFSPDGKRLVTTSADGTATMWDATTGRELFTLIGHAPGKTGAGKDYNGITGVVFNPDGTRLATASDDGTARIWDATTGQELLALRGHAAGPVELPYDGVVDVAFSPDGTRLATAGADGTAKVWDATSGQELLTLSCGIGIVVDINFSPDGSRLVTAGIDGTAKVWDLEASGAALTGQESLTLSGSHVGVILAIDFSPDGMCLATTSEDGRAKVWDATSGQELLTLSSHTGALNAVAFSPDGRRLATASEDGTVRLYVLPIEELIALAQSRVTRSLTDEECRQYLHVDQCPDSP